MEPCRSDFRPGRIYRLGNRMRTEVKNTPEIAVIEKDPLGKNYHLIKPENGVPIKAWVKGVSMEDPARQQLLNAAQLPIVYQWIAAMPDVHYGIDATVGSVIPTKSATIPAAV